MLVSMHEWDEDHADRLAEHEGEADVVYPRWRTSKGYQFPYSPYSRMAHLQGLDFVGTDVLLSPEAAHELKFSIDAELDVESALRDLAFKGYTFKAVDLVTYTKG